MYVVPRERKTILEKLAGGERGEGVLRGDGRAGCILVARPVCTECVRDVRASGCRAVGGVAGRYVIRDGERRLWRPGPTKHDG